jgi:hypothetical protein
MNKIETVNTVNPIPLVDTGDIALDTLRKLEEEKRLAAEEPIIQDETDIGAKDLEEKVPKGKLN